MVASGPSYLATVAVIAMLIAFLVLALRWRRLDRLAPIDGNGWMIIRDGTIISLHPSVRDLLAIRTLEDLRDLATRTRYPFARYLDALLQNGTPLDRGVQLPTGEVIHITGKPFKGGIAIHVHDITTLSVAFLSRLDEACDNESEAQQLIEILSSSPNPIWKTSDEGNIIWANAAYRSLIKETVPSGQKEMFELPIIFRPDATRQQIGNRSFEILMRPDRRGGTALDVTAHVKAEASIRHFTSTLTQTFAHLPQGMMIFDRERRLTLFNPAASKLFDLEPSFLAMRPSLRAVLDRLRHSGKIPEPEDFRGWRQRLLDIEETARNNSYNEDWTLLDGTVVKVKGHAHPEGALAFQFEDVTDVITLERRLRAESSKIASVSEQLTDAIALFAASGRVVSHNRAYHDLLTKLAPQTDIKADLKETIAVWQSVVVEEINVQRVTDFLLGRGEQRQSYHREMTLIDGRQFDFMLTPLPDGGSMMRCAELSVPNATLRDQLREIRETISQLDSSDKLLPDHIAQLLLMIEEASRLAKNARNISAAPSGDPIPVQRRA